MDYENDPGWQYLRLSREKMLEVRCSFSYLLESEQLTVHANFCESHCGFQQGGLLGDLAPLRLEEELLGAGPGGGLRRR